LEDQLDTYGDAHANTCYPDTYSYGNGHLKTRCYTNSYSWCYVHPNTYSKPGASDAGP
jgi:hypothetical protein